MPWFPQQLKRQYPTETSWFQNLKTPLLPRLRITRSHPFPRRLRQRLPPPRRCRPLVARLRNLSVLYNLLAVTPDLQ
mgnify:CR=1 FL=1